MGGYDVLRILLDMLTDLDLPKLTKFSWLSNLCNHISNFQRILTIFNADYYNTCCSCNDLVYTLRFEL